MQHHSESPRIGFLGGIIKQSVQPLSVVIINTSLLRLLTASLLKGWGGEKSLRLITRGWNSLVNLRRHSFKAELISR